MISFFSNIFGYALNIIYSLIKNYGIAIILFSILLKLLLLPLSMKQQKAVKKTEKIQKELKVLQERYKNNPEKLNQEMMALYKRENMSPFSGCFSAIIQIIILFAMFSLVGNPLTYMLHIENNKIENVAQYIKKENGKNSLNKAYPEISIIKYVNKNRKVIEISESKENTEENENIEEINEYEENIEDKEQITNDKKENIDLEELYINMDFLGLDLSEIPQQNYNDIKVFIIPILYVISSIISIKITTNMQKNDNDQKEVKDKNTEDEVDMAIQMNKNMSIMMPILAVMVSLFAPLGLALYWLTNNILMIIERIILNKIIDKNEEEVKNG